MLTAQEKPTFWHPHDVPENYNNIYIWQSKTMLQVDTWTVNRSTERQEWEVKNGRKWQVTQHNYYDQQLNTSSPQTA